MRSVIVASLIGFTVIVFYCLAGAFILAMAREETPPQVAAQLQERHGGLYGPATDDRTFAYKLERHALRQPDILIVGSRRLAAIPGEAFSGSVYNAAGVADAVDPLIDFVRQAVAAHRPKSILIGLDYWWFNPERASSQRPANAEPSLLQRLFTPLQWLFAGKTTPGAFLAALLPSQEETGNIGALAALNGEGWDAFGRYDDGRNPGRSDTPAGFDDVAVGPSSAVLMQLEALADELNSKSIEVIFMLPPMSSTLHAALAKNPENRLIPLWRDAIRSLGQRVFDFQDPASLGATDCEFLNDLVGGEVLYLRALHAIGDFGGTLLSQAIDLDMSASLIASNADRVRLAELLPAEAPSHALLRQESCDKDR